MVPDLGNKLNNGYNVIIERLHVFTSSDLRITLSFNLLVFIEPRGNYRQHQEWIHPNAEIHLSLFRNRGEEGMVIFLMYSTPLYEMSIF